MFKVYYYRASAKVYLDRTALYAVDYSIAVDYAMDNASSMPDKRIYIESAITGINVISYININGIIRSSQH